MPRPIVMRLNGEINKAVVAPDLRDKIDALGFIPTPSTPEQLAEAVKRGLDQTAKLVKAAGIEPE
jgi:tripartite-type tricarboxylate transporter receptor subunit TctC